MHFWVKKKYSNVKREFVSFSWADSSNMCPVVPVKPVNNSVHMEPKESNSKPGIPQLTAGTPGYHQPSGEAKQEMRLCRILNKKKPKRKKKNAGSTSTCTSLWG